jgi:hypothetical protein
MTREQDGVDDITDLAHTAEWGKLVPETVVSFRRVHRDLDRAR